MPPAGNPASESAFGEQRKWAGRQKRRTQSKVTQLGHRLAKESATGLGEKANEGVLLLIDVYSRPIRCRRLEHAHYTSTRVKWRAIRA